ncbi:helix-turn-helix transcriptional regulator [Zymobacter sp. IVIA_5232.4 C2]|uniref:helix-turn-helix transcriptional regulator n=1 Tax=Zymobacter sp. IVIA_5232.4 C2 TaxID=3394855 RepID=UPI0039C1DFFB
MNDWKLALFTGLSQASGMEDIIDTAAEAVRHHDFDYCGWKILLSHPSIRQKVLTVASADEDLYAHVVDSQASLPSSRTTLWAGMTRDELYAKAPELVDDDTTPDSVHSRWCHSARDTRTGAYCVFYANSLSPLSQEQLQRAAADLQWIAAAVHASMLYMPVRQDQTLTLREQNVLTHIGNGMTIEEIADRMRLSLETTAFHVETAEYKLQTPDPQQAVAKALFFDLLD